MKIVFYPDADAELTDAVQYYEARNPGLGSDFLAEIQKRWIKLNYFLKLRN